MAEQVKKNLKKQLQRPLRKDSPIVIQEEVVIVAKSTTEVKEAVVRHRRLRRELRLSVRL